MKSKLPKIVMGIVVLALTGYGLLSLPAAKKTLAGVLRYLGTPRGEQAEQETVPQGPSFLEDRDNDRLSDAKEEIYGTDPDNPDTDGDGMSDGAEVRQGVDPTTSGQGKIADNPDLMANLSIAYFEWARETSNIEDPQLSEQGIQTFLVIKKQDKLILPTVDDSEIVRIDATGPEVTRAYLDAFAQVLLPPITADYLSLAEGSLREDTRAIVDTVVLGIDATYEQIRRLPTPPEALEVQRRQLQVIKALKQLFLDLRGIRRDPVKLIRDISWGNELILFSADTEKRRQELDLVYTNPAFQQRPAQ